MKANGCDGSLDCATSPLERPRYFPRQLITPAELNQAQDYFRRRMRLHNRLLHGWGTVCGTEVCRTPSEDDFTQPDPWRVKIKPGYVIAPQGDDIFLDREVIFDLRTAGLEGASGESLAAADDPWCSRVCMPREPGPLFLAVRYKECLTRPVRVQPDGCGCEGEACEYSRVRDGYEIGILESCPPSHEGDPPDVDVGEGPIPACPPCPEDPWVVLAEVEIDENGIVGQPDNCSCRRMVLGLAGLWWRCGDDEPQGPRQVDVTRVDLTEPTGAVVSPPATMGRGDHVLIQVHGSGYDAATAIETGPELIRVRQELATPELLVAELQASPDAAPGLYSVWVTHPGLEKAEIEEAIKIVGRQIGGGAERPTLTEVRWRRGGTFVSPEFRQGEEATVTISSEGIARGARLELADGFEVTSIDADLGKMVATIKVLDGVAPGSYTLRVVAADGTLIGERDKAVTVLSASPSSPSSPGRRPATPARRGRKRGDNA